MLSRFFRHTIALVVLAIAVSWAMTYSRHQRDQTGSGFWEIGLVLGAVAVSAVWVIFSGRDSGPWVAAGRTLGFKSVYSERLPQPPFPMPEQVLDALGRTGSEFDVYLAHRGEQHVAVTVQNTLSSGRDRDDPPLFGDSEEGLTEPYPVETFALINSRALKLPRFHLQPEGIVDRLLDRVDVDFDSHPKFSRRYRLWGMSELMLRTLFTPALLEFLAERPGWSLEGYGSWLMIRRENRLVSAKELPGFVREVLELHGAFTDACT